MLHLLQNVWSLTSKLKQLQFLQIEDPSMDTYNIYIYYFETEKFVHASLKDSPLVTIDLRLRAWCSE